MDPASIVEDTVYPKKYAHGFCFAVLCCGYTLTDFPISIRRTSLALWQSNDCPSASKATLIDMDKYFMWIHYERLHNHNKAKHNKTMCIFLGIYCTGLTQFCPQTDRRTDGQRDKVKPVYPLQLHWVRGIRILDIYVSLNKAIIVPANAPSPAGRQAVKSEPMLAYCFSDHDNKLQRNSNQDINIFGQ